MDFRSNDKSVLVGETEVTLMKVIKSEEYLSQHNLHQQSNTTINFIKQHGTKLASIYD